MTVTAVDRLLDRNMNEPHLLGQARYARIVSRAITRHDGDLYTLDAWVVVQNHVHLLIEPHTDTRSLAIAFMDETEELCETTLWAREYYEQGVTGDKAELIHWIENHPVRGSMVTRPEQWKWSSAFAEPKKKQMGPWRGIARESESVAAA